MAYGLDVKDLIYTDTDLYDLGTLEDYTVDLDIAKEKNFELEIGASADFQRKIKKTIGGKIDLNNDISQLDLLVPIHGYWYIEDTEFGGVIDKFKTDNENYSIKYMGRSWRGIMHSKIFVADNSKSESISGRIDDVINDLLVSYDLDYLFECTKIDETEFDEEFDIEVDYEAEHGMSIYDIIYEIASELNFKISFRYIRKYKKVFITCGFATDYTDEMTYDVDSTVNYSIERNLSFTNHYILTLKNESTDERYTIHVFRDELGNFLPYTYNYYPIENAKETDKKDYYLKNEDGSFVQVDSDHVINNENVYYKQLPIEEVIKDDQYIRDKSKQVMFHTDEICEYMESSGTGISNYEKLEIEPKDWSENYKNYYKKVLSYSETEENNTTESWKNVEAVKKEIYNSVSEKPNDWDISYMDYYTKSWSSGRTTITSYDVYIRTEGTPYTKDWFSLVSETGEPLTPSRHIVYRVKTFCDYYTAVFEWEPDELYPEDLTKGKYVDSSRTAENPDWTYSSVGSESTEPGAYGEQIIQRPVDWDFTYANYSKKQLDINGNLLHTSMVPYETQNIDEPKQYQEKETDVPGTKPIPDEVWKDDFSSWYHRHYVGRIPDPDDPRKTIDKYEYIQYEAIPGDPNNPDLYTLVPNQPPDWAVIYDKFYHKVFVDDGVKAITTYEPYAEQTSQIWVPVPRKPSNWDTDYGNYYYRVKKNSKPDNDPDSWEYIAYAAEENDDDHRKYVKIKGDDLPTIAYWKEYFDDYYKRTVIKKETVKPQPKEDIWKFEPYEPKTTTEGKYVLLKKQPKDFKTNYDSYYYDFVTGLKDRNGKKIVEKRAYESRNGKEKHPKLTYKPTDWNTNFSSYYKKKSNGKGYESVPKPKHRSYPKWKKNKYYGPADSNAKPPTFGKLPADDKTPVKSYMLDTEGVDIAPDYTDAVKNNLWDENENYEAINIPTYDPNNTWMQQDQTSVPPFVPGDAWYMNGTVKDTPPVQEKQSDGKYNVWKLIPKERVPEFDTTNTWLTVTDSRAPEFVPGKYYEKRVTEGAPEFDSAVFYKEVMDHYKNMVDELIKKVKEEKSSDSQNVTLSDYDLDIGDIVGGKDNITGLYVTPKITNIVVKIDKGEVYFDYSMDDEGDVDMIDEETSPEEPEEEEET